jgi:hypothetical protein
MKANGIWAAGYRNMSISDYYVVVAFGSANRPELTAECRKPKLIGEGW